MSKQENAESDTSKAPPGSPTPKDSSSQHRSSKQPASDGRHPQKRTRASKFNPSSRIESLFAELEAEPVDPLAPPLEIAPPVPPPVEPTPQTHRASPIKPPQKTAHPRSPMYTGPLGMQAVVSKEQARDEQVLPIQKDAAKVSWESLRLGRPVVQNAQPGKPALLAYGVPIADVERQSDSTSAGVSSGEAPYQESDVNALLLEIVDENPERIWSDDELQLVEQVTDQLSLALENARLYSEEQRRRQIADALSNIARAVSSTLDVRVLSDRMLDQLAHLVEFQHASIQLSNNNQWEVIAERNTNLDIDLSSITNSESLEELSKVNNLGPKGRQLRKSLAEPLIQAVVKSRKPLLLPDTHLDSRWVVQPETAHIRSWMAAPMLVGENVVGLLIIDHAKPDAYSSSNVELISTIASQVAVVIQNAHLFEQTQSALTALEVSERYQKSVAQAVTTLTERGIAALPEVLQILGEAAQTSRAYYIETQVDPRGSYWRLISEWHSPDVPPQLNNPALRRMSTKWLEAWIKHLREDGYIATSIEEISSQEQEFFKPLGTRSVLQFAVPGRHDIPGCMGFEQIDHDRVWTEEEISALQTASSALASTTAREDLFTQVQINLAETEALYQASARLNSAASHEDILSVLRQHTILGHINASHVSLNLFDQPWTHDSKPSWLTPITSWATKPYEQQPAPRFSLEGWHVTNTVMHPERATVVMDISSDSRIDDATRKIYTEQFGAISLIFAPLNVAGRWIGHIIATYRQMTGFPELENRRLMSLTGQAAVAIESLRLLDETRQRNEELAALNQRTQQALLETETLYQASAELNAVKTYDEIVQTLRKHTILGESDTLTSINLFNRPWIGEDIPETVVPIAHWTTLPREKLRWRYTLRTFPAARILSPSEAVYYTDFRNDPRADDNLRELFLDSFESTSAIFVPMFVGGLWIGFLLGAYRESRTFSEQEKRYLTALAGQAAVAVQNLNSVELAEQRAQEAQRRSEELVLINNVVSAVAASLDLQHSLTIVTEELAKALNAYTGIGLVEEERNILKVVSNYSPYPGVASTLGIEIPIDGNVSTQRVIETHRSLLIEDAQKSPMTESIRDVMRQLDVKTLLIIPLVAGNEVIGTVGLEILGEERTFTPEEIRLAETIVLQASTAIQNANLFQQTQDVLAETEALYQAGAQFQVAQSYDDILEVLHAFTILGQNSFFLSIDLFNRSWSGDDIPEWASSIAKWGNLPPDIIPARYPLSAYPSAKNYLSAASPTVIENLHTNPRMGNDARSVYSELFKAECAIFAPLMVGGEWIGYVNALYKESKLFSTDDTREVALRQLMSLVGQAAVAIQNLRLLEESRRRANQLQTAAEIARDTSSTLTLEALLERSVNLLRDRFGYYHASIFLIDDSGTHAVIHESTGKAGEEMKRAEHKLLVGSRSVIGTVTLTGESLVLNDVNEEQARLIHHPNPLLPETRAELGIPLKIGDRVIGALDVQATLPNAFSEDDVAVLQTLTDQIAVAVDNARAYELVQKAMEEIREADRLKSQFLANMSHELRTPLNSIIGFSRVILKGIDGPINELQHQDLAAIYNSGQHLLGLINDVLDLSKIEAGKMELAFENNINLATIINSVMSTTVGLVKDKPIELKQMIDPNLPNLRLDPMKIRQVLLNLLSNAAKFTEKGSITVNVELLANETLTEPTQHVVIVRVIDTGPGIAPEDQAKLFQPFSQVDGSLTRKTGGSGLGLSICQHLIRLHGGQIGVESTHGAGSTFYFTLPVELREGTIDTEDEQIAVADVLESIPREQTPPGKVELEIKSLDPSQADNQSDLPFETVFDMSLADTVRKRKNNDSSASGLVLAIDKDPQVADLYRRYLSNHDFTLITLTELDQVLTIAKGVQPYAITIEINMQTTTSLGKLNGWQVLKSLKSDVATAHIPVIICSLADEQERAFELGADAYLMKPIMEADLITTLNRFSNHSKGNRSAI